MSIPSVQSLSVTTSHMLNVVKNCSAVIVIRLIDVCQYRFVAGTALVVSTTTGISIGWLLAKVILKVSENVRFPNTVLYGIVAITVFVAYTSIAAINILVSKKLQLPLPIWSSVLITITTMVSIGLAIAITQLDED